MDKRIKTIEFTKCNEHFGVIVNNSYEIWDDGIIYDYSDKKDIPAYIFKLKDMLLGLQK